MPDKKKNIFSRTSDWFSGAITFMSTGIWERTDDKWYIRFLKVVSLSVKSFFDRDLQTQASSLTYSTLLATVPVLAMIFAIARGFGFQNILKTQIFHYFPAQREALEQALAFVDNYLSQASEGIFVGVGIIVMLWTLIALVWNVEDAFNLIWGVKEGRSIWRKITDYTAIFLILPLLMICASGINVLMSSTLQEAFPFKFLSPMISGLLDAASLLLTWMFFVAAYMLIPNTRIAFKNALPAGILTGLGFMVLQWLFVSGTIYVSRYNAIYGSFAFLPLLLVWLQLVWVLVLSGAVICYSSQSIGLYSFIGQVKKISPDYRLSVLIAVLSVIIKRFEQGETPPSAKEISINWGIPLALVDLSLNKLEDINLINRVIVDEKKGIFGFTPAMDPEEITLAKVTERVDAFGEKDFIPGFGRRFSKICSEITKVKEQSFSSINSIKISDLFPD